MNQETRLLNAANVAGMRFPYFALRSKSLTQCIPLASTHTPSLDSE